MKILFFFILGSTLCLGAYGQSTLPLRADTVTIEKVGGNATLKIKNATRDSTGGVLYNIAGGVTVFKKSRGLTDSTFTIGGDTLKIIGRNWFTTNLTQTSHRLHNGGGFGVIYSNLSFFQLNAGPFNQASPHKWWGAQLNIEQTQATARLVSALRKADNSVDSIRHYVRTSPDSLELFSETVSPNTVPAFFIIKKDSIKLKGATPGAAADSVLAQNAGSDIVYKVPYSSGGGGTITDGAEGIRKNGTVVELGDVAGQNLAPLTVDRYIRSGNRSIYFQGNKTVNGEPNIILDDSATATPGNPKPKNWIYINSLDHVTPPFILGTNSIDDGTGFNNHVMNWGFNLTPMSTRLNPAYGAIGLSIEGAFQQLQEFHFFWVPKDDLQRRILSFTCDTLNKTVDLYHQVTSYELKNVANTNVWAQYTGGNGGTNTSFYLMSGNNDQYNLQYGFGVGGGNTSASIVTTGPGNKSFSFDSWSDVQLPRFNSFSTYNEFEAQAIPNVDGTHNLGNPTNRWGSISGMTARSANGVLVGSYAADELPVCALEIRKGAPTSGQGQIQVTNDIDNTITGFTIKNTAGGHVFGELWAETGNGSIPTLILRDADNPTTNFAQITLARNTPAILGEDQNDLIINNGTDGKEICFGTTNTTNTIKAKITSGGNFGVGVTTPTAVLHLKAGTATASTAPLKLTSGTNLTTPEDGAIEYNGTHFYATIGSTRHQLDQQGGGSTTLDQAIVNGNALTATRVIDLATFDLNIKDGATDILGLGPSDVFAYRDLTAGEQLFLVPANVTTVSTEVTSKLLMNNSTGEVIKAVEPKIYTSLLTQSGTSNPTALVLGTNTVGAISWARTGTGVYTGTLSGAFTVDKTWLNVHLSDQSGGTIIIAKLIRTDANTVTLSTFNSSLVATDVFTQISLEIKVYP